MKTNKKHFDMFWWYVTYKYTLELKHASDKIKNYLEKNAERWAEQRGSDGVWGRSGEAQWLQHLLDLYVHSGVLYGGGNLSKQSVL